MRVIELMNELQKYPLDAFVKMSMSEVKKSECPGYDMIKCTNLDISDVYFKKDENYPVTGILYLTGNK